MAEPIGIASGLLTLAAFAFKSSVTLHTTIKSIKSHPKRVRSLLDELEELSEVLHSLTQSVDGAIDGELSALKLPLLRCGKACEEFGKELKKCSSRSGENTTSFRDWARLQYMGGDMDNFTQMLTGCKSTITIALTDASLRRSSVTASDISSYKDLIKTATDDLEAHLQIIDEKLESVLANAVAGSSSDTTELQLIKEEKLSTQTCLRICSQLSDHISQIHLSSMQRNQSTPGPLDADQIPKQIISEGLQECQRDLRNTAEKLEGYLRDVVDRMLTKSKATMTPEELADLTRLKEEWEMARQCIGICSKADNHLKDSITVVENYATGDDSVQLVVSTEGKTIHGKNRGFGLRVKQVGGHMNDISLQQISRDFTQQLNLHHTGASDPPSGTSTPPVPAAATENPQGSEFGVRYGQGRTLSSNSSPEIRSAHASAGAELPKGPKH